MDLGFEIDGCARFDASKATANCAYEGCWYWRRGRSMRGERLRIVLTLAEWQKESREWRSDSDTLNLFVFFVIQNGHELALIWFSISPHNLLPSSLTQISQTKTEKTKGEEKLQQKTRTEKKLTEKAYCRLVAGERRLRGRAAGQARNLICWQIGSRFSLLDKSRQKTARDNALRGEGGQTQWWLRRLRGCDEDGWAWEMVDAFRQQQRRRQKKISYP